VAGRGAGRFFEDYRVSEHIRHAVPRTVTDGDRALYMALYPSRFALWSSDEFARACGLPRSPLEDLVAFHVVFGKTVPDISLNAVANLGYAEGRFLAPVYPGDTLMAESEVIGLRETSNGKSGVVWVRTTGRNQRGEAVLSYCRWVMVRKRDAAAPAPAPVVPELAAAFVAADLVVPAGLDFSGYDFGPSITFATITGLLPSQNLRFSFTSSILIFLIISEACSRIKPVLTGGSFFRKLSIKLSASFLE
jgi:2-methylfumaryl-CoA hydratase